MSAATSSSNFLGKILSHKLACLSAGLKSANLASHRCICASTWLAKEPSIMRDGWPVALPRLTKRPSDSSSTKSLLLWSALRYTLCTGGDQCCLQSFFNANINTAKARRNGLYNSTGGCVC
jgi:hypothetical protein